MGLVPPEVQDIVSVLAEFCKVPVDSFLLSAPVPLKHPKNFGPKVEW